MLRLIHKSIAEGLGAFAIVFFGCGAIIASKSGLLAPALVPLIFGLIVTAMVYTTGHLSGAHLNPAITLAFAVARHFPKSHIMAYWLAQCLGAILASVLLSFLFPSSLVFGATISTVPILQTLIWEIVLTFFLMLVIIAVATDTRAVGTMAGVAIGAIVTVGSYLGGPYSGASMNPARSLGPAIFEGQVGSLWIYIVGPAIGAVLAALVYEWMRCDPDSKSKVGCC